MILKSDLTLALDQQRQFLTEKELGLIRENLPQVTLNPSFVRVITGIRRCGKSTLMLQLMKELPEPFAFFNFEDPRVFGFEAQDFAKLGDVMDQAQPYYFFDEVQNVEGWEVFIRHLHDRRKIVCLTGSNASLLSKELATRLTGRSLHTELFPFSYREYIAFKQQEPNTNTFLHYIEEGGFPDYLKYESKEILQQLLKDILYRDIIVRHGIRNDQRFTELALFLLSNVGKPVSLNRIKNSFEIGSVSSVADYIRWLEDSYLLFSLPRFSWSAKKIAVNPKKIYAIDTGFARVNSLSYSKDTGRLFENAVFLHLRRAYRDLYYFQERHECDFLVKEANTITQAIQVCAEINQDNQERETKGLFEALSSFGLDRGSNHHP